MTNLEAAVNRFSPVVKFDNLKVIARIEVVDDVVEGLLQAIHSSVGGHRSRSVNDENDILRNWRQIFGRDEVNKVTIAHQNVSSVQLRAVDVVGYVDSLLELVGIVARFVNIRARLGTIDRFRHAERSGRTSAEIALCLSSNNISRFDNVDLDLKHIDGFVRPDVCLVLVLSFPSVQLLFISEPEESFLSRGNGNQRRECRVFQRVLSKFNQSQSISKLITPTTNCGCDVTKTDVKRPLTQRQAI